MEGGELTNIMDYWWTDVDSIKAAQLRQLHADALALKPNSPHDDKVRKKGKNNNKIKNRAYSSREERQEPGFCSHTFME